MDDTTVTVIPSSIDVGKMQTVVVIFPCDLPQHQLVTLELCCTGQSSGKRPSPAWVPAQLLGSNVLRANLPEIPYAGDLEVTIKVSRETFDPCPSFKLRVISPLETILQASFAPQKSSSCNGSASLPCLAAYLLHTHEKDQSKLAHMDRVVTDLLQSQSSLCSDWNLSSVIFGERQHHI
ncbi:hypothetical protein GBAR_LOCUS13527 [Geodia barretti]|uniref:Uncharacterized protein n=1 Tax=Geodia barretti TaxID=519541 RepID=A0AA35WN81_GEOBA|nr:hypothetical protein GBAR_LOCUS13527 [Geodia barretti]